MGLPRVVGDRVERGEVKPLVGVAAEQVLCLREICLEVWACAEECGVPGLAGKEPEVITIAIAAQVLQLRGAAHAAHPVRGEALA